MKWIDKYLVPAQDKLKHFYLGTWIMFICLILTLNVFISLGILLGIAVAKEVYDYVTKKGTPEILDVLHTVWPGILFFIYWILN